MRVRDRVKQIERVLRTYSPPPGDSRAMEVAKQLYESLDTPTSLGLKIALDHGDIESVVNHSFDPRTRICAHDCRKDYLAVSFLKKYPFTGREHITRRKAVEKFLEAEDRCRDTNLRFRRYRENPLLVDPTIHSIFHGMTRKISSILGTFDYDSWLRDCRFGPGATDVVRGPYATIYHKLSAKPSVTTDAAPVALRVINHLLPWLRARNELTPFDDGPLRLLVESDVSYATGNKVSFVPKDARSDRAIAIEPHLNIFLQLGVGKQIRQKLQRVGVDLNSQSLNQDLALLGSKTGIVATIDLSSASDTISREVVREFLPCEWFEVLDIMRSKTGHLENHGTFTYQKFSSMGNGFTFELESLIFYALAWAVCEQLGLPSWLISVYGDDIIIPTPAVDLLHRCLEVLGFKVNDEKSFWDGPFRESCGRDFYDGYDVRPIFLKEKLNSVLAILRCANAVRFLALKWGCFNSYDKTLKKPWLRIAEMLPKTIFNDLRGPLLRENEDGVLTLVEGCLGGSFDESQRSPFVRRLSAPFRWQWDGVWYGFPRLLETAKQFKPRLDSYAYATWLYGLSNVRNSSEITKAPPVITSDDFRVPYRGLTTERLTVHGRSRGWQGDVLWE